MQKRTVEVSGEVEVQYDEQATEFQESLAVWNDLISDGSAEDLVKYVLGQLKHWGDHEAIIEGVGRVGLIGQPPPASGYCGIQVSANYGQLHFALLD